MRFSLTIKLFLIVVLVFVGIFSVGTSSQAKVCGQHDDSCDTESLKSYSLGRCCTGTVCEDVGEGKKECVGGLFTRGQSDVCLEQGNCSRCDLLIVVKNVFQFLVQIAGALAVLSIVIAGVMYMLGGGALGALTTQAASPGVQKAKNALTAAIVGLLIVLFAWTMITWMMNFLGYTNLENTPWYQIQCESWCCNCQDGSKAQYYSKTECNDGCSGFCEKHGRGGTCQEGLCGVGGP